MCKGKAGKVAEKKQGKQIQYLFIYLLLNIVIGDCITYTVLAHIGSL